MTGSGRLIARTNLGEFFLQEVTEARDELGIELKDSTEYYLVNLLCEYSRTDSIPAPGEEPLALIYKRAIEAELVHRIQLLKNLGDVALYVSGFFAEFIERSLVDVDYYIAMGGNAYGSLSSLVGRQRHGDTLAEIYLQLGQRFTELVDLLTQIAERSRPTRDDVAILRLYDRWARTGSERIHRMLVERGLVFAGGPPTEYEQ